MRVSVGMARVLTTGRDRTARLWQVANGDEVAVLRHEGELAMATFAPDGQRVVTIARAQSRTRPGDWSAAAFLWEARTGQLLATLRSNDRDITGIAFSPDGTRMVTAANEATARVWSTTDGRELLTLSDHENFVPHADFSADGHRILTVAYDRVAHLWDARSGKSVHTFSQDIGVRHAILSPDGTKVLTLSSGADEPPRVWESASGRLLGLLQGHDHQVTEALFSPDGKHIVTWSTGDGTVRLWDATRGRRVALLLKDRIQAIAVPPDSSRVMILGEDGTLRFFPLFAGTEALIQHARGVVPRRLSPDDRQRFFLVPMREAGDQRR